jgi:hypothetical protein
MTSCDKEATTVFEFTASGVLAPLSSGEGLGVRSAAGEVLP